MVDIDEHDSPSKASSSGRPDGLQHLGTRRHGHSTDPRNNSKGSTSRRVLSRSHTQRPAPEASSIGKANATFLTECSFGVAHDRLVEVITDVQPFEPYWEELASIDLSNRKLESVARLKEFLPRLDALSLYVVSFDLGPRFGRLTSTPRQKFKSIVLAQWNPRDCEDVICRIKQVCESFFIYPDLHPADPSFSDASLRQPSLSLTGITSYSHLLNLENLDISRNDVDSLRRGFC